jgi:hypothetical protein
MDSVGYQAARDPFVIQCPHRKTRVTVMKSTHSVEQVSNHRCASIDSILELNFCWS